jgi:solute carrier family 6 amino acid transporter-like protein 5/7/9/14
MYELGTDDIRSVVKVGTGLAFVSYPDAIAKFDVVPQVCDDIISVTFLHFSM